MEYVAPLCALALLYVFAGVALSLTLGQTERFQKLLGKMSKLDMMPNREQKNTFGTYALFVLGWPLILVWVWRTEKSVELLEQYADVGIVVGRLPAGERDIMATPRIVPAGRLTVMPEDVKHLERWRNLVEPILMRHGFVLAVSLPKTGPVVVLYRKADGESASLRTGRRAALTTFPDGHGGVIPLVRLDFARDGATAGFVELTSGGCGYCFRPLDENDNHAAIAQDILDALVVHNAECPNLSPDERAAALADHARQKQADAFAAKMQELARQALAQRQVALGNPLQKPQADVGGAARTEVERVGGGLGQVDDASLNVRAAIVHLDNDGRARVEVGHFDLRPEGQGFVSGGEGARVEGRPAGGEVPLEAGPVPARDPGLVVVAGGAAGRTPGAVGGVRAGGREHPTDDPPKAA